MNDYLVSVIVPVYNVESYLTNCLNSIIRQTYKNIEVLLIDDGSTDNSGVICDNYQKIDKRIITIHKTNGGLSSARNVGIQNAKGNYIFFVDSDDYIEIDLIKKCVDLFNNSHADLIRFAYKTSKGDVIGGTGNGFFCFQNVESKIQFITKTLIKNNIGWETWRGAYKKSIIDNYSLYFPDNNFIFAEDMFFTLIYLFYCNSFSYLDNPLYNYTIREDSIIGKTKTSKINEMNHLSLILHQNIKSFISDVDYSKIHFFIINNRFNKIGEAHFFSSISNWKKELSTIDSKHFFMSFLMLYRKEIFEKSNRKWFLTSTGIKLYYFSTNNKIITFLFILTRKALKVFIKTHK